MPSEELCGRVLIERYQIEEMLGSGAFGAVYRATDLNTHRIVAIKVLHAQHGDTEQFVNRFWLEGERATRLKHRNIVDTYDVGVADGGLHYMTMEVLKGRSLEQVLKPNRVLSEPESAGLLLQILCGLEYAHSQGIVHRDLKPDNVYLVGSGDEVVVKILDFGVAKDLSRSTEVTRAGAVIGTPHYMSPEQCRGEPVDARSDVYSLGCIAFQMLSGRPPFEGDSLMTVLYAHVNSPPPFLPEYVTQRFSTWVQRCLSKCEKRPIVNARIG